MFDNGSGTKNSETRRFVALKRLAVAGGLSAAVLGLSMTQGDSVAVAQADPDNTVTVTATASCPDPLRADGTWVSTFTVDANSSDPSNQWTILPSSLWTPNGPTPIGVDTNRTRTTEFPPNIAAQTLSVTAAFTAGPDAIAPPTRADRPASGCFPVVEPTNTLTITTTSSECASPRDADGSWVATFNVDADSSNPGNQWTVNLPAPAIAQWTPDSTTPIGIATDRTATLSVPGNSISSTFARIATFTNGPNSNQAVATANRPDGGCFPLPEPVNSLAVTATSECPTPRQADGTWLATITVNADSTDPANQWTSTLNIFTPDSSTPISIDTDRTAVMMSAGGTSTTGASVIATFDAGPTASASVNVSRPAGGCFIEVDNTMSLTGLSECPSPLRADGGWIANLTAGVTSSDPANTWTMTTDAAMWSPDGTSPRIQSWDRTLSSLRPASASTFDGNATAAFETGPGVTETVTVNRPDGGCFPIPTNSGGIAVNAVCADGNADMVRLSFTLTAASSGSNAYSVTDTNQTWDPATTSLTTLAATRTAMVTVPDDADYEVTATADFESGENVVLDKTAYTANTLDCADTTAPVEPTITFDALGPVCFSQSPYIEYVISGVGLATGADADLTIRDASGAVVLTLTDQPLTGRILWPGASVDPLDWPGWILVDGEWQLDPSDAALRGVLTVEASVNPTTSGTVSYPEASAPCANPPAPEPSTPDPSTVSPAGPDPTDAVLPTTGPSTTTWTGLLGGFLAAIGIGLLFAARRRDEVDDTQPTAAA